MSNTRAALHWLLLGATATVALSATVSASAGMKRSASDVRSCGVVVLNVKPRHIGYPLWASAVSCTVAREVMVLNYGDGVPPGKMQGAERGWTCAFDHYACYAPSGPGAVGSDTATHTKRLASGSTHGVASSLPLPKSLPHQLLMAAARAMATSTYTITEYLSTRMGPFNGRKCLPVQGQTARVCSTVKLYYGRQDDVEWAYGSIWDTRTEYTDADVLWERQLGYPWQVVGGGYPLPSPPGDIAAVWHLK